MILFDIETHTKVTENPCIFQIMLSNRIVECFYLAWRPIVKLQKTLVTLNF